jgi:hypothetical protein
MSVLQKLTEGIVNRSLQKDGDALLDKWNRTGLLEGLNSDRTKNSMACLLENQAKELLREASAMSQGDVEGFAAVAFPIVRRVFGGLVANDLVSVQPMSLPSGLIFFLDFTHTDTKVGAGATARTTSVYGGGAVASGIASGVGTLSETGYYDLQSGYASPTGSASVTLAAVSALTATLVSALSEAQKKLVRFDPDLLADTTAQIAQFTFTAPANLNTNNLGALDLTLAAEDVVIRRLTSISGTTITVTIMDTTSNTVAAAATESKTATYAVADSFAASTAAGSVVGGTPWGLETTGDTGLGLAGANADIPEIDIKVDSIAVTAITKKLKAKWTPELGQDLNAYHNLDAEVELTGILSEQIALEIDQEILNDLVQGATAGTLYWSRRPGQFLDPEAGTSITSATAPPDFTGTVSEWYETLVETINDVSARIHRKTLRGGANFIVCGPEVANLLEFTSGFRAKVTADDDKGEVGAVNVGSISKKWDVFVDPYFLRNVILVGRKGSSFLESGYVYAPYVPLQVTPTIFGPEDFLPRKGVMTRYAKKMVRPDLYGLVVVENLIG